MQTYNPFQGSKWLAVHTCHYWCISTSIRLPVFIRCVYLNSSIDKDAFTVKMISDITLNLNQILCCDHLLWCLKEIISENGDNIGIGWGIRKWAFEKCTTENHWLFQSHLWFIHHDLSVWKGQRWKMDSYVRWLLRFSLVLVGCVQSIHATK